MIGKKFDISRSFGLVQKCREREREREERERERREHVCVWRMITAPLKIEHALTEKPAFVVIDDTGDRGQSKWKFGGKFEIFFQCRKLNK